MKMQVVVGIDETAGQAGRAERLPLPGDFITDPAAVGWSEGEQDSGSDRGTAPGPIGLGQGTRVAEVQVPADFQGRKRPGEGDGVVGAGLAHHQARAGQRAMVVGVDDRPVDQGAEAEVIGDKGELRLIGHQGPRMMSGF